MKKLTIIIPFYKYSKYLEECLFSLTESNFKDFEVLLVLDNVQEDITSIVETYEKQLSMRVITLQGNTGVGAARNAGLREVKTPYLYFLDSDDYILDHTLEVLMNQPLNAFVYGKVKRTYNKRDNFLANILTNEEEVDEELFEETIMPKEEYLRIYEESSAYAIHEMYYELIKARKGFVNISVLGCVYETKKIHEHNLYFDESFKYFGDLIFLVAYMNHIKRAQYVEESLYVKRRHNDPINFPSNSQASEDEKFEERMRSYRVAKKFANDRFLKDVIDIRLLKYIAGNFAKSLRRSQNPKFRGEWFDEIKDVSQNVYPYLLQTRGPYTQSVLKAIRQGNQKKALRIISHRFAKRKYKRILKNKNELYKFAYFHLFLKMKVRQNVVLFESFLGKNYSDSPKYIYEYLQKHYAGDYEFVWVLNQKTNIVGKCKTVRRFSFRYAYYLARSKYLVFNVRQPLWFRKRKEQVFVQTWHGTPLKRLVFDQEEVTAASPTYKMQFYRQRVDWDYLISANDFSTETLARCFMFENTMLDYGYPRNDILYADTLEADSVALKKKLNIPLNKKTILYAPTWRDDEHYEKGKYKFNLQLDLQRFMDIFKDEYVILLRTHHYISDALDTSAYEGFVFNLSKYDDISQIYTISDICITDYSSVFFDFANLRRPILFYTYDFDKYKNMLRGFYIDMEKELPGPLLYTNDELIEAIQNINQVKERYAQRYEEFYNRFCHLDDGQASKKVVERVFLNK